MTSPVPKHLITDCSGISRHLRDHVLDLKVDPTLGVKVPGSRRHRAKFAPGLASALVELSGTDNLGDPMCGVGTLAHETKLPVALNDMDSSMSEFHSDLSGCEISYNSATAVTWVRDTLIFSPPYYPKTDRKKPNAIKTEAVGFRDSYEFDHPEFIGNPGGVNAILKYRKQMTAVYSALKKNARRMIVVVKNWTRLGVELRLDWDTILMAESVGWICVGRTGFKPKPSLWSRYNKTRGDRIGRQGMVQIEDVLIFHLKGTQP